MTNTTSQPCALLSVSDRTGLIEFAEGLCASGYKLLASDGTAAYLKEHGIQAAPVSSITDFPPILDGRVKTLHPAIFGGILARDTLEDAATLATHNIPRITMVVCNLYPFTQAVHADMADTDMVEYIDIGGVSLLRAAAKNFAHVSVICQPADYAEVLEATQNGTLTALNRRLAAKAFRHTMAYDAAISAHFERIIEGAHNTMSDATRTIALATPEPLRYGENPHQKAAFYPFCDEARAYCEVHAPKPLSYNNLLDSDAAIAAIIKHTAPTVAIIKHNTPCGVATAKDIRTAYDLAYSADPESAFGGIIAVNQPLSAATLEHIIANQFAEVILAPSFPNLLPEAVAAKNVRLLAYNADMADAISGGHWRTALHGLLHQSEDGNIADGWEVVGRIAPNDASQAALRFAWQVVKMVKSNAIVYAHAAHAAPNAGNTFQTLQTLGIGAGQTSRVMAVRIAGLRMKGLADKGTTMGEIVMASDAFLPFADNVEAAHADGVTAIIQPGGSKNDTSVIARADELGIAMVMTGKRYFCH